MGWGQAAECVTEGAEWVQLILPSSSQQNDWDLAGSDNSAGTTAPPHNGFEALQCSQNGFWDRDPQDWAPSLFKSV